VNTAADGGRVASLVGLLVAGLLGALPPLIIFGPSILRPSVTGWLTENPFIDDPSVYLLSWDYFRHAPRLWPPGSNPDYGLEIGSSIFYADAVPLLAIGLKFLGAGAWVAQYLGVWIVGCGALQAVAGWALMGLVTRDPIARVSVAGLLAWQPMLLWRMSIHMALAGQFLICAAIFLCLRQGRGTRHVLAWLGLIYIASLVNSYLLAMVAALWLVDLDGRNIRGVAPYPLLEFCAGFAVAVASLWLSGFFLLSGGHATADYGQYNLDLLAPFDGGPWSRLLPDLPGGGHSEAGASYLGLGALLLIIAGACLSVRGRLWRGLRKDRLRLFVVLVLMWLFAVTFRLEILGRELLVLPVPELLTRPASMLRASERFFWPVAYLAIVASAMVLDRVAGKRAGLMLAALLALQIIDIAPGVAGLRKAFTNVPPASAPLATDPFWREAASRYERLRAAPTAATPPEWTRIARIASELRLPTDAVYLARLDLAAVRVLAARVEHQLNSGDYEPGTIYVLRTLVSRRWAEESMDPARDLIREADGLTVLAPGWWATPATSPAP